MRLINKLYNLIISGVIVQAKIINLSANSFKEKSKYVRLVPIKNYLNGIDLVNHIKLQEKGLKGFSFQVEISSEVGKYLDSI